MNQTCFGLRRPPGTLPTDTWNQGAKREALLSLHADKLILDNFYLEKYLKLYIDKYVNKTIHIKGTPTDKLYYVAGVDFSDGDLENPTFIYIAGGTIKDVKAKNVTGFKSLEIPSGKYLGGPAFGSRRRSRFGLNVQPWNLDSKRELRNKFNQLWVDKFNYYENIYKGKDIHIKGTPKTELHIVRDFRMYEPIGTSMFDYYDENGEFKSVMAKDVTGFNKLPPPPEGDLFNFGSSLSSEIRYLRTFQVF